MLCLLDNCTAHAPNNQLRSDDGNIVTMILPPNVTAVAWDELSTTVLQKTWSKILNWDDKEYDDEDNTPLSELQASKEIYDEMIAEAQLLLSKLGKDCTLTIEEIEEWNADFDEDENEDECDVETGDEQSSKEQSPPQPAVPYGDAIKHIRLKSSLPVKMRFVFMPVTI